MILINGCSFSSLPGQWQDYIEFENKNLARPGNNNESIFLDTANELFDNYKNYSHVVILWTFIDRYLISTDLNEEISVFPYLNRIHLTKREYEQQFYSFKKILYSYFHSEKLQLKKLNAYQKSIDAIFKKRVIHLNVSMFNNNKNFSYREDGHLDKKAAINFAKYINGLINE